MCPSGGRLSISRENTSDFRSAFDILDTDHDGKISSDDLRTFYTNTTPATTTSDEEIGTMISVADSDKDGFVEFDEFKRVLNRPGRVNNGGVMEDVFRMMDRDGDGMVGFHDLKSYMEFAGFSATDQDIETMIKLGGGDENAGVSFRGFLKILAVDSVIGL